MLRSQTVRFSEKRLLLARPPIMCARVCFHPLADTLGAKFLAFGLFEAGFNPSHEAFSTRGAPSARTTEDPRDLAPTASLITKAGQSGEVHVAAQTPQLLALCHGVTQPARTHSATNASGTNLGPTTDGIGPKRCTVTQNKAKRSYQIEFFTLPGEQVVEHSQTRTSSQQ